MCLANISQKGIYEILFQKFKQEKCYRKNLIYSVIDFQFPKKQEFYPPKSNQSADFKEYFFSISLQQNYQRSFYYRIMSQSHSQYQKRNRQIIDIIHGRIEFDQTIWGFIDTPHFQRLRRIKQLGGLSYVYPSATNTRFEHCIGTAYLAKRFIQSLVKNCSYLYSHLKKSEIQSIIRTITLAGLLHDIGHGPFSHSFDTSVVRQIHREGIGMIKWSHELASEILFDHMTKLPHLKDKLTIDEIKRIKLMINGTPQGQRLWQFDLISNKHNGIDVDKFDYFRRDTFCLGDKQIHINHELLISQARIIDNKICFPLSLECQIIKFYQSRYKLYQKYYYDYTNKSVEMMICDIMILAKDLFSFHKICEQIYTDPSEYMLLTDHIIEEIQSYYYKVCLKKQNKSQIRDKSIIQLHSNLEKAIGVLNRIRNRDLYKLVKDIRYFESEQSSEQLNSFISKEISFKSIIQTLAQKTSFSSYKFHVLISDLNCGVKAQKPLEKVDFFSNQFLQNQRIDFQNILKSTEPFEINSEKTIKIFIRSLTPQIFQKTENALNLWMQQFNSKLTKILPYQTAKKSFLFQVDQREKYFQSFSANNDNISLKSA